MLTSGKEANDRPININLRASDFSTNLKTHLEANSPFLDLGTGPGLLSQPSRPQKNGTPNPMARPKEDRSGGTLNPKEVGVPFVALEVDAIDYHQPHLHSPHLPELLKSAPYSNHLFLGRK